jgi:D-alanine transaminase/branched-chain amino acid aminotransferase
VNSQDFVFVNDAFVPRPQAHLPVDDLAVQRGYGVFDFFRVLDGQPVFLDDHLDRFERSAERMRLPLGRTRGQLKEILRELVERNAMPNSGVRLTLSGGCAADGYTLATPNLVITQRALPVSGHLATTGIRLTTFEHQRQLCDVKTIDYLMAIWLQPLVAERGADDVLYHQGGLISECPRSNAYIVTKSDQLATPARSILKGVNRKHVLDIARGRMVVEERDVHVEEMRDAKEAFITSTTKGVVPVVAVDARPIGDGRPGEATRWLGEMLSERAKTLGVGWGM